MYKINKKDTYSKIKDIFNLCVIGSNPIFRIINCENSSVGRAKELIYVS